MMFLKAYQKILLYRSLGQATARFYSTRFPRQGQNGLSELLCAGESQTKSE